MMWKRADKKVCMRRCAARVKKGKTYEQVWGKRGRGPLAVPIPRRTRRQRRRRQREGGGQGALSPDHAMFCCARPPHAVVGLRRQGAAQMCKMGKKEKRRRILRAGSSGGG